MRRAPVEARGLRRVRTRRDLAPVAPVVHLVDVIATRPARALLAALAAALAADAHAHSNTFVGSADLYEAEEPGAVATEYWLTFVGADERSWQHSAGLQVGLWRGLEASAQATLDVAGPEVTPVQIATSLHLQLGHEGKYPVDVAIAWKPWEREVEAGRVHHRTGLELILARDLGDLSIAVSGGLDVPAPELDLAAVARYPRHGPLVAQLLVIDEPDAGRHHVVAWPSLELAVRGGLSVGLMAGVGLTRAAAPLSFRTALSFRVR